MSAPELNNLVATGLTKAYRGRRVVDGVSLRVEPGEVVGLLGPNGAGKTTSFNMISGLVRPDAGTVMLGGVDLSRSPMHKRARAGLGYLPQETSVFRRLSAEDNLRAVLELQPGMDRKTCEQRVDTLLSDFEIDGLRDRAAEHLSGGERRRVEIARCLASAPKVLLLDEPFAGVDPIAVQDLQGLISQLRARGLGVLITDHSVRETLAICDRAYILVEGRVLEEGTRHDLAQSDRAKNAYLGQHFELGT